MVDNALDRELYEEARTRRPVWEEGDDLDADCTLPDAGDATTSSTSTSGTWCSRPVSPTGCFKNAFNRDSYDDNGATMKTVNNDPGIACPNANWNGADDQLLRRRHLRRRGRARVGPRLHRVHLGRHLPVAVGRAQRVLLRHLGRDRST